MTIKKKEKRRTNLIKKNEKLKRKQLRKKEEKKWEKMRKNRNKKGILYICTKYFDTYNVIYLSL